MCKTGSVWSTIILWLIWLIFHAERRSTMKLPPIIPVPLEHLDPQTPPLTQLVSQWQKLWYLAAARQSRLEQHQQMLKEVIVAFYQNGSINNKIMKTTVAEITLAIVLWLFFFLFFFQMEEFANFDFNIWRKRYMQWISHMKSRILDVFRTIDRDQDGRIRQKEFIDYVLASSKTICWWSWIFMCSMSKPI